MTPVCATLDTSLPLMRGTFCIEKDQVTKAPGIKREMFVSATVLVDDTKTLQPHPHMHT